jgi:RNA polymerase sigma factor (sigma-70 family)
MTKENPELAAQFEASRSQLRALAYRMLGSGTEAEDAVQEAWLRVSRADAETVDNLGGWLTTIVARVCLDLLRTRKSRREEPETEAAALPADSDRDGKSPEHDVLLADSVGLALLVVLETLTPTERLAFVLHDTFDLPFEEIASIIDSTPAAARQLASRARRKVRGASAEGDASSAANLARQREVVDAFLTASRSGDLGALLAVLDPNVVFRADPFAVEQARKAPNAPAFQPEIRGRDAVAQTFNRRAQAARPALIDGQIGAVWAPHARPRAAFTFHIAHGQILRIDVTANPKELQSLDLTLLDDSAVQ